MKSIGTFIIERLKVTKPKSGDCTLEEFLVWYYFDNKKTIEDLTFDEFFCIDFEPQVVEAYFGNNEKKLYDFLMDHLDDEIELHYVEESDYTYYRFFIDNISFTVENYGGQKFERNK